MTARTQTRRRPAAIEAAPQPHPVVTRRQEATDAYLADMAAASLAAIDAREKNRADYAAREDANWANYRARDAEIAAGYDRAVIAAGAAYDQALVPGPGQDGAA